MKKKSLLILLLSVKMHARHKSFGVTRPKVFRQIVSDQTIPTEIGRSAHSVLNSYKIQVQKYTRNMKITPIKKEAMKHFLLLIFLFITQQPNAQETLRRYLSGKDKDTAVQWDFMVTSGRNSNRWTKIHVPSCWETQGFGTFYYGWEEPETSNETGYYRYSFTADKAWENQHVQIVFEAAMTDTEVKINGQLAGNVHEGGFYQFGYNITHLLRYGKKNMLEVKVAKRPVNKSIYNAERQSDFWLFGGIYRPVFLEIKPQRHIQSLAIDARADGNITVRPYLSPNSQATHVSMYVEELDGTRISDPITVLAGKDLHTHINRIIPWNQESPYLYNVVAELKKGNELLHRVCEKTGFRTIEFRPQEGFYLNGERIIFKGVNRHCFWPETGRTLSRKVSLDDAILIKSMNMNAVRMSHYPPDEDFLEICDSLGLLVINELCGWQKKYDTPTAHRLIRSMVERDRNHPSIVLWANGNEGGWNTDTDDDYQLYDLQQRFVIHPWERFRGTDTKHYPDYNYVVNSTIYNNDVYFPTEFMHGLFDGGNAASLKDFWEVMMRHRAPAGGFLWALLDEGVVRHDLNDRIDCKGDLAPDGIVGPYREKEGSYYAIKEIWSPIQVLNRTLPESFDGALTIENHYMFTDLATCKLSYRLVDIALSVNGSFTEEITAEGTLLLQPMKPGERKKINLNLPSNWRQHDILYFTATDPQYNEIYTWSWPIGKVTKIQNKLLATSRTSVITATENDTLLYVYHGKTRFIFSKNSGMLVKVETSTGEFSLSDGPAIVTSANKLKKLNHYRQGNAYIVEPLFEESQWMRWIFAPNEAPRFEYAFHVKGEINVMGVGINYPEEKIRAMEWIGEGPYRVWKNRMEGTTFGRWYKEYNNTVTGESWSYPEFKGYYANCRAVTLHTSEGTFSMIPSSSDLFFQMLKPEYAQATGNSHTAPPFPQTNLGFMHAIPAIGTKFQQPEQLGPSGQKNMQLNWAPIQGSIWFIFE